MQCQPSVLCRFTACSITNNNAWNYTWENILAYNTTIAKDHNLGGSLITSWNKNQSESSMAAASGQMVDQWSFWRLTSGTSQHVESDFAQTQKMSFAFRLNYSYKGKYLFNFSTRWTVFHNFLPDINGMLSPQAHWRGEYRTRHLWKRRAVGWIT